MADVEGYTEEMRLRALLAAAGLELSDDEIAAVLPNFLAQRQAGVALARIDLGETPPAAMFHPEGHARYPASESKEAS
jgi:ABC-type nitrate/sulfonate/bicarbonate transport system substrate-binding protein